MNEQEKKDEEIAREMRDGPMTEREAQQRVSALAARLRAEQTALTATQESLPKVSPPTSR